jgi:hypothetical protein
VEHFKLNIENELAILEKYNLTPTELFTIKVILLAKEEREYEWLQRFVQIIKLRDILVNLQGKGIILKSWKLPKEGTQLIVEDIPFNQNFQKQFFRASFEMGEELFYTYPQSAVVQGTVYNLRSVSKHFDSLEQAFLKYAKSIKNNPEIHQQIIDDIKWGIENQYNGFTTLDRFIIDRGYEHLHSMRLGESSNVNLEAIKMI